MDWWVKGSSSIGSISAPHSSVCRAHTSGGVSHWQVTSFTFQPHAPVNKSGSHQNWALHRVYLKSVKEFVHSNDKTGKPQLRASVHLKVYLMHMMLHTQKVLNAPYKYKPICGSIVTFPKAPNALKSLVFNSTWSLKRQYTIFCSGRWFSVCCLRHTVHWLF